MITEDYVSFAVSKLLKEKGFNEECFALYNSDGVLIQSGIRLNNIQVGRVKGSYSTPTLQMAMKWLREVHHIYLNINVRVILGQWSGYDISIHTTDNDGFLCKKIPIVLKDNMSYEQACEAAIKYCLEKLI